MALNKSGVLTGKRQTAMPSPKSAAYKRLASASKKRSAKKSSSAKTKAKQRNRAAYATVEERQRALERVKCLIWQQLDDISDGIIRLAVSGNYMAARALFDLAGVYSMPPQEDEPQVQALSEPAPPAEAANGSRTPPEVDRFFRSIGIGPLRDPPEEEAPAAAL